MVARYYRLTYYSKITVDDIEWLDQQTEWGGNLECQFCKKWLYNPQFAHVHVYAFNMTFAKFKW